MQATYRPSREGIKLNVREEPRYGSEIAARLEAGSFPVERVEHGWAKVESGWCDASFLTITDGAEPQEEPEKAEDYVEEKATLRRMTVAQLTDLAEASGIAIPAGAKKEDIVDAIVSAD